MTSISVTHNCAQIYYQTPTRYRLWGVIFMFPNLIFSHPKSSFQWANSWGRRCPPGWQPSPGAERGALQGFWEFCRSSAQQGGSARQCHLCLAGMPEPDLLDSWTQSPQLVLGPYPSTIKRERCLFSFSFMVSCHEFGWNCLLDGPQTVLSLCCSTFTPALIKGAGRSGDGCFPFQTI